MTTSGRLQLGLAAVAVAAGLGMLVRREPAAPAVARNMAKTYPELARFDPPQYFLPDTGNGAKPGGVMKLSETFRDAMVPYTVKDFPGCSESLAAIVADDPELIPARYYLGICRLLSGDTAAGIAELTLVTQGGESPYLEEARFYLAKAHLGRGETAVAKQLLRDAETMKGPLASAIRDLLAKIP